MEAEMVDLLIHGGLVYTLDPQNRVLYGCDIAIKDGRLSAIGPDLSCRAAQTICAEGKLVLPGLINAHMHETLTRGICEDLPLDRWLSELCFPLDKAYSHEVMAASALMNQLEMIRGGTTTFIDIYRYPDACAQVALKSGLRAIFAPQIILNNPGTGETIESAEAFVADWKGRSPLITPAFGPHAPYSCSLEEYSRLADLAQKYDVLLHTHLAETQWEVGVIRERYGLSPTEMLEEAGALSPRLSVAHAVHLSEGDVRLLAERGVRIAYNPTSNMKLASGVARIPDYQAAGICVALGTDSNLSNNNLDLFEEMRTGAILQKLSRQDATALNVETMLRMATLEGSRAFGLQDEIGSLEVGKQADLILVDLNQPHLWPQIDGRYRNIAEQVVYSANAADVTHTIVAGQVLMADRQVLTLDVDEARSAVQQATTRLLCDAGLVRGSAQTLG